MRRNGLLKQIVIGLVTVSVGGSLAYGAEEEKEKPAGPAAKKRHILYLTHSQGFNHPVLALSEKTLTEMGRKSGAFEVTALEGYKQKPDKIDLSIITPEYLRQFDAIVFYTTGELPFTAGQKKAIVEFVKSGRGIVGIHGATDTYREKPEAFPEWAEMLGARFRTHGPKNDVPVIIDVKDRRHPATRMLPAEWKIADEIYQFAAPVPRDKFRILMSIDGSKLSEESLKAHAMEKGRTYEVAWCRDYGKGRVFYTSLGHRDDVWTNPLYQQHLIAGIRWAMGDLEGDATPTEPKAGRSGFSRGRANAKIAAARVTVGAKGPIALAISLYRMHVGEYPTSLRELAEKPVDEEKAKKWRGPYVEKASALKDPWDQDLQYKVPGEHGNAYDLWSIGPDGKDGTKDDIGNWK